MEHETSAAGSVGRVFSLLRLIGSAGSGGIRLTDLAERAALPRPTTHRILRALGAEAIVAFDARSKRYTLGLDLFLLAARAGNVVGLRDLARPTLLRLTASLGETLFLLVHNGYDAVCIERSAGPLPIRSFTGDIGGRVPLGIGQGSVAILAFLPPAEQDEAIRHNLPRMRDYGGPDEASLRAELLQVRRDGFCGGASGLIPGMAGVGVPILDAEGRAVAALSIGTTTDRLTPDRKAIIAGMLRQEATAISRQVNPFDPTLRRAAAAM
ncbi:IclR family transcriptional regulator [Roseomonas sp. CECT 9278]|uniref:IclR family transcriptional regulator n=1 Tax=Roseomonas sp. CECT 9278 TaxID=2845823 RepID=UPI001E36F149|nr:IclR family transcriptional regulator [Roseomonas sp. CECT 9278]CAH0263756.1 HTH-type transcriptional regulator KipR [Roseomonas sp. CECT 9278]